MSNGLHPTSDGLQPKSEEGQEICWFCLKGLKQRLKKWRCLEHSLVNSSTTLDYNGFCQTLGIRIHPMLVVRMKPRISFVLLAIIC